MVGACDGARPSSSRNSVDQVACMPDTSTCHAATRPSRFASFRKAWARSVCSRALRSSVTSIAVPRYPANEPSAAYTGTPVVEM